MATIEAEMAAFVKATFCAPRITLARHPEKGWFAAFEWVENMPHKAILPLPWTADAPYLKVAQDISRRFPDAAIYTAGRN